jgi:hypothetical protein
VEDFGKQTYRLHVTRALKTVPQPIVVAESRGCPESDKSGAGDKSRFKRKLEGIRKQEDKKYVIEVSGFGLFWAGKRRSCSLILQDADLIVAFATR